MDAQSESSEPTACEPPPPGRINKAAFKLFGRRKPGSTVPAIFSVRGKGEGSKAAAKAPLTRSKTHDGLAEGGAPEESADAPCEAASPPPPPSRPSISSVASVKSLSFLTLLRGGGRRGGGTGRRGGLRGLLGSVRWPRRARGPEDIRDEAPPPSDVLLASRSNSVEIVKEHMTLTPRPPPRTLDTAPKDSGMPSEGQGMRGPQLARPISLATSPGSPPAVPSMDLLSSVLADISSLGSFDSPAASSDVTSDTNADFRAASPTEQGRGRGKVFLPEKSTLQAAAVPSTESRPVPTARSPSTAATTPPISTATSIPSLSPKTSSAQASTTPCVPTSKPAPAGATPIPTATITSTTTATPVLTITSTPSSTVPKATPVLTPTITTAAKATPISTPTTTSGPKTPPVLTTPTPPLTTDITSLTLPKLATPSTLSMTLTPTTTTDTAGSKSTTVTTAAPTVTSVHGLKPVSILLTTCTPVSSPTPTTTFTPFSKPAAVLPPTPVLTSTSAPKPCPSVAITSSPAPDLTPISTITSVPKHTASTAVPAGGQTPVSISGSIPASIPTAPKPVSSTTVTSTPVFTAGPTSTVPVAPDLKPTLSLISTPKPFLAPGPTAPTKSSDVPTLVEESQSRVNEVSEDWEAGPCKLDPQRDRHSPSLPHTSSSETGPTVRQEKKPLAVSKIPVSGSSRAGKPSRDAVPEEGQLDHGIPITTPVSTPAATPSVTPAITPSQEDEGADFSAHWNSSSNDVHYPSVDPTKDLEMCSKLTPPTRAPGAARTTRIPVKQTQLASSARQVATTHPCPPQAKPEVPRTKIPVSKVPVRRGTNKPPAARQSPHDLPRK